MTTDKASNSGDLKTEVNRIEDMINSPSMRDLRSRTRESIGYVRPKNASTMILLGGPKDDPVVLMGKRNQNLKFMPGALVFPGGSVDKHDGSIPAASELSSKTEERLIASMRGRPTRRGARALALAAVREVAEESGLLVGKAGTLETNHPDWDMFAKRNIVPSLDGLRLFSRAVTPPGMSRRFDTWFFISHASHIGFTPKGGFEPSGELEGLQWIRPEDAISENTREITRVMLVELIRRLRQDPDLVDNYPAPYYHTIRSRFHKTII